MEIHARRRVICVVVVYVICPLVRLSPCVLAQEERWRGARRKTAGGVVLIGSGKEIIRAQVGYEIWSAELGEI